jgi:hypothetical protein
LRETRGEVEQHLNPDQIASIRLVRFGAGAHHATGNFQVHGDHPWQRGHSQQAPEVGPGKRSFGLLVSASTGPLFRLCVFFNWVLYQLLRARGQPGHEVGSSVTIGRPESSELVHLYPNCPLRIGSMVRRYGSTTTMYRGLVAAGWNKAPPGLRPRVPRCDDTWPAQSIGGRVGGPRQSAAVWVTRIAARHRPGQRPARPSPAALRGFPPTQSPVVTLRS